MGFETAMKMAARAADAAVNRAMAKYGSGLVTDEDDLTGVLLGNLDAEFHTEIGGINWSSSILRHRKGIASEEAQIGADMIIHVAMKTPLQSYSKAVLIQAKRQGPGVEMSKKAHLDLQNQCNKMLDITPSSFVFDYAAGGMRCGSASKISGSQNRNLYDACNWTSYRFFLELFRSPIGDPKLTSAYVKDLPVKAVLKLKAEGDIATE